MSLSACGCILFARSSCNGAATYNAHTQALTNGRRGWDSRRDVLQATQKKNGPTRGERNHPHENKNVTRRKTRGEGGSFLSQSGERVGLFEADRERVGPSSGRGGVEAFSEEKEKPSNRRAPDLCRACARARFFGFSLFAGRRLKRASHAH